jgi:lysophospholipase L1-like esterase
MSFRNFLINCSLLLSIVFLCFVIMEIGLRLIYGNPHVFYSPQVRHIVTDYGYKPEPNQVGTYTLNKPVRTNSAGFRDTEEWSLSKSKDNYRILVVGDSFTFGNGVEGKQRFTDLLKIGFKKSNKNVEIFNASAGGWNLKDYLGFFYTEGLDYKPDMIIIAFFINDWMSPPRLGEAIYSPTKNLTSSGRWDARPGWLKWLPYEVIFKLKYSATVMYLRDRYALVGVDGKDFNSMLLKDQISLDDDQAIIYSYEMIKELKNVLDKDNIDLVIAMIPPVNFFWVSDGHPLYIDHFQRFAKNNNFTFIDLSLGLEDKNSNNLYYMYPWDNHLNPAGHKKVADQLEFELKRLIF